jgi:hypothetical protein
VDAAAPGAASSGKSHSFRIEEEATAAVGILAFQGRDLRVRFDRDAPPSNEATAAADRIRSKDAVCSVSRGWIEASF